MEQMDPARREKIEKKIAAKASHKAENKAASAERQARRQQGRLERLNTRLTRAQALAATDPEASQQRILAINQKIARIQQGNAPVDGGSNP
jgi:transcription elongation GreA/GreB family factor